ncbi:unnamed protein product [Onchocerca flexuosa]|uniref:Uncharacterized protein n=1 Tax=Onchocerca flexuosa TaxID=387005 RepID=A0A183HE75_9BILA|nr:unnamed protein product [Onchocerca flexuosa]
MRPFLLQERIDGLDVHVQELIRNVARKTSLSEENSKAIDMDIADSDNDEKKRGWHGERRDKIFEMDTPSRKHPVSTPSSKLKLSSPYSIGEAVSKDTRLLSSDPRREKVFINRDPRKRLVNNQNLPIPSCSVLRRKISNSSSLREHSDAKKKPLTSSSDLPATDFHGYSSSDATSSEGEFDNTESPASPPHEPDVFVATAPKIISDYDMRSTIDASFQTPAWQYRPPEITPFTALASVETLKNPGPLVGNIDNKHESKIDFDGAQSQYQLRIMRVSLLMTKPHKNIYLLFPLHMNLFAI